MDEILDALPKKNNYKPKNIYGTVVEDVEKYILERC